MGTKRGGALEVTLTDRLGEPAVHVEDVGGERLGEVWLHLELRFGTERHTWDVGPLFADASSMDAPLLIPSGANVHPEQARYLTPLKITASTAQEARTLNVALAWPDGLDAPAEVWDGPTAELRAPQGVLDPALRMGAESVGLEGFHVRVHVNPTIPRPPALAPGAEGLDR